MESCESTERIEQKLIQLSRTSGQWFSLMSLLQKQKIQRKIINTRIPAEKTETVRTADKNMSAGGNNKMDILTFGVMPNMINWMPPHMHSTWEVLYYIEGHGILKVGDQSFEFEPGVIVCQPPNILHTEYSESGYRNMYFFGPSFVPPNDDRVTVYSDDENLIFGAMMQLGIDIYASEIQRKQEFLKIYSKVIYEYLSLMEKNNVQENPFIIKIKDIILDQYKNPRFDLNRNLKDVGFCSDYLRKLFKKQTGMTPHDYLTQLRIENAKNLLETQNFDHKLTIREIAQASGFSDPYYFSKVYKKVTGESPSQAMEH